MFRYVIGLVVVSLFTLGAMQFGQDTLHIIPNDPVENPSGQPMLEVIGDSTDINAIIKTKGYGSIFLDSNGGLKVRSYDGDTPYVMLRVESTLNQVNNLAIAAAETSVDPRIFAEGSDTNIDINMVPKGTGTLQVNAVNVPTISSTDTLTNKTLTAPIISAQTASAGTAMKLTSGDLMTTPEVGAMELDTKVLYFTPESTYRGVLPTVYALVLSATNTLTSSTSEQPLFDVSGSGALTLPGGTFFFETTVSLSAMSATSGNLAFDLLGAGTATIGSAQYTCQGIDGAVNTAAAWTGVMSNTAQSPASVVTAATSTECQFTCTGVFRVTAGGTIIPSGTLVTAAAAVVATNSYFQCNSVGRSNLTNVGPWG